MTTHMKMYKLITVIFQKLCFLNDGEAFPIDYNKQILLLTTYYM